jgi:tetraacyldisaccharide 4'-kinase
VRLIKFTEELRDMPLYVLPIRHRFLFNAGNGFDEMVLHFIRNFKMKDDAIE